MLICVPHILWKHIDSDCNSNSTTIFRQVQCLCLPSNVTLSSSGNRQQMPIKSHCLRFNHSQPITYETLPPSENFGQMTSMQSPRNATPECSACFRLLKLSKSRVGLQIPKFYLKLIRSGVRLPQGSTRRRYFGYQDPPLPSSSSQGE